MFVLSFNFNLFNVISNIIDYIGTLLSFITSMITVVFSLFATFFVSMPNFISVGFSMLFGLGMTILIVKLVR